MNRLILGIGTGRCGTKSLTRLLEYQDDTIAKHERFGPRVRWGSPSNLWPMRLWYDTIEEDTVVSASVDFKWTGHIEYFIERAKETGRDVRIIGLKRDRQEVIESYDKWKPNADHWSFHGYRETKPDEWDHCYPVYNTDSKKEGIGLFWDEVYDIIHTHEEKEEFVRCFRTQDLNTEKGVKEILDFCGYDDPNIEVGLKIKSPSIRDARNSNQW